MQVRLKTGRYAGELRDIRPDCAKQMIADGRATDARGEVSAAAPPLKKQAKTKRGAGAR